MKGGDNMSDIEEVQEEYEYQVRELSPEEMDEYSLGDPSDLGVTAIGTRGTGVYGNRFDDNARIKLRRESDAGNNNKASKNFIPRIGGIRGIFILKKINIHTRSYDDEK